MDKEAILKKHFEKFIASRPSEKWYQWDEEEFKETRQIIYDTMDEYSASLKKENEELRQINDSVIKDRNSYRESFETNKDQFMELAAHAKDLETQLKVYTDQTWYDEKYVEAKEKEIERLKGLIEKRYKADLTEYFGDEKIIEHHWQQFKSENNL